MKRDFNQFIDDMHLIDLPLLGRKFTWVRSNGYALSRLDRFLVSESWLESWGGTSQRFLIYCLLLMIDSPFSGDRLG